MQPQSKPFWLPDTQGFLALTIMAIMAFIVISLLYHNIQLDERTSGVLMTIIGVLVACVKDVFSFFFGSSRGSEKKDDALISGTISSTTPPPSPNPGTTTTTTTSSDPAKAPTIEAKP